MYTFREQLDGINPYDTLLLTQTVHICPIWDLRRRGAGTRDTELTRVGTQQNFARRKDEIPRLCTPLVHPKQVRASLKANQLTLPPLQRI